VTGVRQVGKFSGVFGGITRYLTPDQAQTATSVMMGSAEILSPRANRCRRLWRPDLQGSEVESGHSCNDPLAARWRGSRSGNEDIRAGTLFKSSLRSGLRSGDVP